MAYKQEKIFVKSYAVAPDARGAPKLSILTDKKTERATIKQEITSFIEAVYEGLPATVQKTKRTTPTGGEYYYYERID